MSVFNSRARNLFAAAALAVALCGCVVTASPYYGGGALVAVAPPAPRVEVVGVAPAPGYFWVGGYWGWSGNRHVWVPGRWAAPRAGHVWVAQHWVHESGGWRSVNGHWARR